MLHNFSLAYVCRYFYIMPDSEKKREKNNLKFMSKCMRIVREKLLKNGQTCELLWATPRNLKYV